MPSTVFLVGPMGAGKTTIGRLLAQKLALPFKDIDHLVVERAGADIPWIFDVEGEQGFRKRETAILEELIDGAEPAVVATGGGIVTVDRNRQLLKSAASSTVFLYADVDQQFQRTAKDKNRPLLQSEDPRAVLEQLTAVRLPLYREVADFTVDTGKLVPRNAVSEITAYCKSLP